MSFQSEVMSTGCTKSVSVDLTSGGINPPIAVADVNPTDSPTEESNGNASEKRICVMCLTILLTALVGGALRLLGMKLIRTHVEYVCGGLSPSRSELEAREFQALNGTTLPICLHVSVREDVMCLRSGDPVDQPPVYCQTNVGEFEGDESGYWYLWFSNCTVCGTAWRMFDTMTEENKSSLKLPTPDVDTGEAPLGTKSWLAWDSNVGDWRLQEEILSIEECDETNGGDEERFFIPSACYVEKVSVSHWKTASNTAFGIAIALLICCCCKCAILSSFLPAPIHIALEKQNKHGF